MDRGEQVDGDGQHLGVALEDLLRPLALAAGLGINGAVAFGLVLTQGLTPAGAMGVIVRTALLGRMIEWLGEAKVSRLGLLFLAAGLRGWLVGAAFVVGAFSVAGVPPSAGFFGKVAVFQAGVAEETRTRQVRHTRWYPARGTVHVDFDAPLAEERPPSLKVNQEYWDQARTACEYAQTVCETSAWQFLRWLRARSRQPWLGLLAEQPRQYGRGASTTRQVTRT